MTVILAAQHVCKQVDDHGRSLLQDINLTAQAGEFLSVIGPSGSGKTTLLQCLSGLQSVTTGQVELFGKPLTHLTASQQAQLRRTELSFIFQSYNLLPALSVLDNIALPLRLTHQAVERQKIEAQLAALQFHADLKQLPAQLPGGEQQKVAIVRALMTQAKLIFADEPTGALDSVSRELIFSRLRHLAAQGVGIVMVTHDIELAAQTDRAVVLRDGQLVAEYQTPNEATLLAALHEKAVLTNA